MTTYVDRDLSVASHVEADSEEEAEALLVQRGLGERLEESEHQVVRFPRTPRPSTMLSDFLQYPTEGGLQFIGDVQRLAHIALRANPGLDPIPLLADAGPAGQAIELVGWVLHDWLKDLEGREDELEDRIHRLRQDLRELEAMIPGLPT
jgi:hypothetical protein